jgi:hypothetical protein
MKAIVKGAIRNEKGQALILALILLAVGGLILAPLLAYMRTGLTAGGVCEVKMDELYAADAGVEDAVWKIQNNVPYLYPYVYPEPLIVNDKSVDIIIFREDLDPTPCGENFMYQILSTATSDDGSDTTIEAYLSVSYLDLSTLLDNAIVSQDTIQIQPGSEVNGDVWLPDKEDLDIHDPEDIHGEVKDSNNMTITWPTADQLSSYYLDDVNPSNPYPDDSIDVKDTETIGACYRDGSLTVDNTGDPDTLVLEGTVYVTGNLEFEQSGASHNYTVNLNGHTIFAEGSIDFPSNVVTISGSGCIIAIGDIDFNPSIASGEDDFVLVMSITGQTYFHPSGDFTGCVAGNTLVQLQPGSTISWISPEGKGLDVPWGVGGNETPVITALNIVSWEIK